MSRRTKRVAELLRHEIGAILHGSLSDPRVDLRLLTVTRAEVTSDLCAARVYVSVLGGDAEERTALRGLNSARKRIRAELGERIEMRRVPDLEFMVDEERKRSRRMNVLLAEIARERGDENLEAPDPASEDDPGNVRQQ